MTDNAPLSRAAERLIARHIHSVGTLDLLLLLHGGRDRDWSLEELCGVLRCPDGWAEEQIAALAAIGLVGETAERRYQYRRGRQYGPATDAVARACRRDRAAVTRLIFARPPHGPRQLAP